MLKGQIFGYILLAGVGYSVQLLQAYYVHTAVARLILLNVERFKSTRLHFIK